MFTKGFLQAPNNPDLSDFKRRGGKLITYQGLNDLLNAEPLIDYVNKVERIVGGADEADDFMRMYLVPGMNHCGGGPGVEMAVGHAEAVPAKVQQHRAQQQIEERAAPTTAPPRFLPSGTSGTKWYQYAACIPG